MLRQTVLLSLVERVDPRGRFRREPSSKHSVNLRWQQLKTHKLSTKLTMIDPVNSLAFSMHANMNRPGF